eukprot:TRINITY_DN51960_c0_g1_i1.p1 TRINITY_DN51960_c0_g1~~TRINITY_DN51960_c0_g1_i1.p1  ORF type:complete len:417 (+),score=60.50 TRINITY_DN51960_c0_g1_i1:59-1252(+)
MPGAIGEALHSTGHELGNRFEREHVFVGAAAIATATTAATAAAVALANAAVATSVVTTKLASSTLATSAAINKAPTFVSPCTPLGTKDLPVEDNINLVMQETSCRGVAAFAARDLGIGETVIEECAVMTSTMALSQIHCRAQHDANLQLWNALVDVGRSRRVSLFDPAEHIGALVALRDLGPRGCRQKMLTKCCDDNLPCDHQAKRDVEALRAVVRVGLLPKTASSFSPAEYARLRRVIELNGFRFNGSLDETDPFYDVGEVVFNDISRINHSCSPNASFDLFDRTADGAIVNRVKAVRNIRAGEEVTISYISARSLSDVAERRRQTRKFWNFDCDCCRCMAEGEPPLANARTASTALDSIEAQELCRENADADGRGRSWSSSSCSQGACWDDLGEL